MKRLKSRSRIATIGLIPATVILASACSNGVAAANKAGANQPVVLQMADVNAGLVLTPEIGYFTKRLSELSHGEMSVKITLRVGGSVMSAEQQVVKDAAGGSFDIGFTGTSVFDTLGVTSFQALSAPMLIDNYPLENAVISSALPGKMMAGLAKLNVTGLAVFGDGMRKPIGVRHPILSPADWRGITFETYLSKAQQAAISALGATPGPGFADDRDQALDNGDLQGFELNLGIYQQQPRKIGPLTLRPTSICGRECSRFSPTQAAWPGCPIPSAAFCTRRPRTPRFTRRASSRTKPSSSARYARRARGSLAPRRPTWPGSGSASRRSMRIWKPIRRLRR